MLWSGMGEAFRVAFTGRIKNLLSLFDHLPGHAVVQHLLGQQGDPAVMMLGVIPEKKSLKKGARVLDGTEFIGKIGPVLEGFELALRVRIVVRDVRAAMSFCNSQI